MARKLAAVFSGYKGALSHSKLIVLAPICNVMLSLELPETGPLLWQGWNAAAKVGDVLLQREFLQILARRDPAGEAQEKVQGSLEELSATGLYGAAHEQGSAGTGNIQALSGHYWSLPGWCKEKT